MNTDTTDTRKDYEIARDELNKLFASLKLTVNVSEAFGMVDDSGWQCIRYTVTINGEPFTYSLGIGHVNWVKARHESLNCRGIGIYTQEDHLFLNSLAAGRTPLDRAYTATLAAKVARSQKVSPNPAEVLACVCREGLDADESFDNWCANFGSDTDSIKALNTYNLCTENGKKARRILGADNFQKFAELSAQL